MSNPLTAAEAAEAAAKYRRDMPAEIARINARTVSQAEKEVGIRAVQDRAKAYDDLARELAADEADTRAARERLSGLAAAGAVNSAERRNGAWAHLVPSMSELRALTTTGNGSATVPTTTANKAIDLLVAESAFLRGTAVDVIRMPDGQYRLPTLTSEPLPEIVGEGVVFPRKDLAFGSHNLTAKKYGAIIEATKEIIEDASIDLRGRIEASLIRMIARKIDLDAFAGAAAAGGVTGLLSQGTVTAAEGATGTLPSWDSIADALARAEAANARPDVVWAAPDVVAALRKAKAQTAGTYLANGPVNDDLSAAWGVRLVSSANVPAGHVFVAQTDRLHFGIRTDVQVAVSEDFAFDRDVNTYKVRFRAAGVAVDEATSVQIVKPAV